MPDTELLSLLKEVELSGAIVSMAASCILPTFLPGRVEPWPAAA